jgi:hypothetical protein
LETRDLKDDTRKINEDVRGNDSISVSEFALSKENMSLDFSEQWAFWSVFGCELLRVKQKI